MAYRGDNNNNSPSLQYEDAPDEPTHLSELIESPADHPAYLHTDGEDVLELQPSPPQSPQHGLHETTLRDDTVGEGSLSVDVDDSSLQKDEDGMHSIVQSPASASLPVASPAAASAPVAVSAHLPVAAPAPAAQPVAAAVTLPPPPPPPPVDPVVAERAAKRAAFFKAQAQRSQQLAAELDQFTKQSEREDAFWSAQEHRCTALLQRSDMADRTSKEIVRFFEQTNRALSRTLGEMTGPFTLGSAETGSLKEACAATEQIRHVVVDQLTSMRDKQLQHCLAHATTLSKVMAERQQAAQTVVNTANRDLKREREQLKANWQAYDKAVQERVKNEFSEHSIRVDPLLPLRSLLPPPSSHHHSSTSHPAPPSTAVLQNQYRTHLSALFLDLKTEEERRIEQTKAFLLQVLMSMNSVIESIHAKVRDAMVAVTSIDAVDDLHHFIESNDLALAESELEAFRATRKLSAQGQPPRKLSAPPPAEVTRKASVSSDAVAPVAQGIAETSSAVSSTEIASTAEASSAPSESSTISTEPSVTITATPPTTTPTSSSTTSADTAATTTESATSAAATASPSPTTTTAAPATSTTTPPTSTPGTPPTASLAPPTTASTAPPAILPTPTVFSLQPPTRDTSLLHRMYGLEVEREGVLHRPGRFFKQKWKEQWVVVSKSGWLHCWDDRSESAPTVSMPLVDVVAQLEKGGGGGIEIVSVGSGGGQLSGGKKDAGGAVAQVFRAENPMEAARWIEAINKYCHPA